MQTNKNYFKVRRYLYLIVVLNLSTSCSFKLSKYICSENPTSYLFSVDIATVRCAIDSGFDNFKYKDMSLYKPHYDSIAPQNNNYHLYSNWAIGKSKMYYNWWGMLLIYPKYEILIDYVSENTTQVSIRSNPYVKTGLKLSQNHGFPCVISRRISVSPSTIEEYELLHTIGDILEEKGMPEIQTSTFFPCKKSLSQK